jgi:hypothetical protein
MSFDICLPMAPDRLGRNSADRPASTVAWAHVMGKPAARKLDEDWPSLDRRLRVVPGKQALAALNAELQRSLRVSVTAAPKYSTPAPADTAADLRSILGDLDIFAGLTIRGLSINQG